MLQACHLKRLVLSRNLSVGNGGQNTSESIVKSRFGSMDINLRTITIYLLTVKVKLRTMDVEFLPTTRNRRTVKVGFLTNTIQLRTMKVEQLPSTKYLGSMDIKFLSIAINLRTVKVEFLP